MSQSLCRCGGVNVLVYVLVILFGVASWVDINGLWVELPILVQNLPEGWDLPSYMAITIQVANIAPLLYTVASSVWPRQKFETPVIYGIISVGAAACLLLALLWDVTSVIFGSRRSTALLVLQFFLALVDCTSSVAFLPFMYTFGPQYMTAYFIGEGFSGLIPSLVALGQGAGSMSCVSVPMAGSPRAAGGNRSAGVAQGLAPDFSEFSGNTSASDPSSSYSFNSNISDSSPQLLSLNASSLVPSISSSPASPEFNVTTETALFIVYPHFQPPRFSVRTFFLVLMSLMVVSNVAFTLLKYWGYCRREHATQGIELQEEEEEECGGSEALMYQNNTEPLPNNIISDYRMGSQLNSKTVNEIISTLEKRRVESKNLSSGSYELLDQRKPQQEVHDSSSGWNDRPDSSVTSSSYSEEFNKSKHQGKPTMSQAKLVFFLVLTAWLNAVSNGVLPSIQTYSCLPYGIQPYHLSVTLAAIANPVACFAASFISISTVRATLAMTSVGSALAGYVVYTAAASPNPPLRGMLAGTVLLVLCWVLVVFFLSYTKVCIATVFRRGGRGPRALLWVGAFTQVGSLAGAVVTFLLVNVYKVFTQGNPCV